MKEEDKFFYKERPNSDSFCDKALRDIVYKGGGRKKKKKKRVKHLCRGKKIRTKKEWQKKKPRNEKKCPGINKKNHSSDKRKGAKK